MRVSVLTSAVGKHRKSSISRKELDSFDNIIKDFCTIQISTQYVFCMFVMVS